MLVGADRAQEEEEGNVMHTPLDQFHCDTVSLLVMNSLQMSSTLLAQDVILIL